VHRACTDLLSALCDRSCCVKIYLFEDDKLRASEDESHDPGDDDHTPATRLCSCRETAHRAADRQIAIETHRCQEERRAGQRHYLYPSHSRNTDSVSQNVPRSLNVMCIETAKLCEHFTSDSLQPSSLYQMYASCSRLRLSSTGPCPATPCLGYLADDCQLVADARVRQLRSADTRTLVVSRTRSSFGDMTFATAGPRVWNSLPPDLRLCGLSYGQFRRLLETFLFGQ